MDGRGGRRAGGGRGVVGRRIQAAGSSVIRRLAPSETTAGRCVALTPRRRNATDRPMSRALPPCPYLPADRRGLDWRALHRFRAHERGEAFYRACIEYAQHLWCRGFAARALLCLDRALGADLRGGEPVLRDFPLPYRAVAWMVAAVPSEVFIGNPRVHFQHYADRMNAPRREQRAARAWACWRLVRTVRPEWPGDPNHRVVEPEEPVIAHDLARWGHPGEADEWREALRVCVDFAPR